MKEASIELFHTKCQLKSNIATALLVVMLTNVDICTLNFSRMSSMQNNLFLNVVLIWSYVQNL